MNTETDENWPHTAREAAFKENIESIDSAIQRQRSAILQALMWLDVGAAARAREVLLEALNK